MNVWVVLGAVLEIALLLLKEWKENKDGENTKVQELQKKRLALLDKLADGDSGWISRNSYNRAYRLRLLLDEIDKK